MGVQSPEVTWRVTQQLHAIELRVTPSYSKASTQKKIKSVAFFFFFFFGNDIKAWLLFIILNLHVCRKIPFFGLASYEFLCMCGLL